MQDFSGDAKDLRIAKNCAADPEVRGANLGNYLREGVCSFRQFVWYITKDGTVQDLVKDMPESALSLERPLDQVAESMNSHDIGKAYRCGRIWNEGNVAENNVPKVFEAIGGYVVLSLTPYNRLSSQGSPLNM